MLPPLQLLFRLCLLALCLSGSGFVYAQPDSADIPGAPKLKRGIERDPNLLVEALTAGKTGDIEKFDAIFTWVASNIKYDYRQYFSGKGSGAETDIKRVLRRRRAICFQYSALMDHLCALAHLHSVTVSGYAKDQLFDVNDTLYFDNHAWNAVMLDDRWYLYDVTRAAGGYEWRLTKFSQRVRRWQENIMTTRMKPKKVVIKVWVPKNTFCKIDGHHEKIERTVMRLPLFWRIADHVLGWFGERYVIDHGTVKNRSYYLTDPRQFAITHFPNVPYWSLTSNMENVEDFSADSAYYHLEKDVHLMQKCEGTACVPCDNYFALTPLEQAKQNIRASLANNPRNGLAPATGYFDIAAIFYKEAELATDSLEKVSSYDSTLFYLQQAKIELKRCGPQNTAFHRFHFTKENQKVKQLKAANKAHTAVNIVNVTNLRSRANKIRIMGNKISTGQRKYLRSYRTLDRLRTKSQAPKPMKDESAEKVRERLDFYEGRADSLDERIRELETSLIERVGQLSNSVWQQSNLLLPQYRYFGNSIYARVVGRLDNRDKPMMEWHDSIRKYERDLSESIGASILAPSDTLYAEFKELEKCTRFRDADQLKTLRLYGQLYVGRAATEGELEAARERFKENVHRDYCYFFQHKLPLTDFTTGYQLFRKKLYRLYKVIKTDTKAETIRHKAFLKEILLTKKRVRNVVANNLKYQATLKAKVKQERRDYIKELKALRRED